MKPMNNNDDNNENIDLAINDGPSYSFSLNWLVGFNKYYAEYNNTDTNNNEVRRLIFHTFFSVVASIHNKLIQNPLFLFLFNSFLQGSNSTSVFQGMFSFIHMNVSVHLHFM